MKVIYPPPPFEDTPPVADATFEPIMRCRMIKSQANIATRHDILVYFFQANVVGNVATSSPMAIRRGGIAHTPQSPLRRKLTAWNLLVRGPYTCGHSVTIILTRLCAHQSIFPSTLVNSETRHTQKERTTKFWAFLLTVKRDTHKERKFGLSC